MRSSSNSNVTYAVKQTLNAASGGEISMCAYSPNRVLATLAPGKRYADFEAEMTSKGFRVVRELMKDLQGNSVYVIESTDTEHDVVEQMTMGIQSTGFCSQIRPDHIFSANVVPNDGKWADQWNMVKIGAPKAWNTRTDASSVLVAVLDTGVNFNHYDLNQNLWLNAVESADMGNGEDDDGNGIVDDVYGIASDGGNVSGNPMDENGHGSHCAGIIGAVGNNRYGVAGVAWKAKIMGLKFLNADGNGCVSDAITCLSYAAQKGVKIINCSFGSTEWDDYFYEQVQIMAQRGVIFVCAAGNATNGMPARDNDEYPFYPCNYPCSNIVAVAATDSSDNLASFSYFGVQNVDIAAPGVDIESSVLGSMAYEYKSGTSMATPHVVGALALLMAEYPDESPYDIVERLYAAGEEVASLKGKVRTGKRLSLENFFGLPAPSAVTASQGTIQDAVGLYWTAVANATHYRVWRAEAVDGTKTALCEWMQGLTFSDETALAGSNYWYFVQAAASAEGADASAYSEGVPGFRPEIPENRVTVTFNANGGAVAESKRNYTAGDTYGEFPAATYSDRVFLGWHTAATGGTRVDNVSIVRQDVTTLFAHWATASELRVENLAAQQRYPWNGKVDVSFDLNGVPNKEYASLALTAKDAKDGKAFSLATYDGTAPTNLAAGAHRVVWNADADKPNALFEELTLNATASIDVPRAPASGTASNNVAAGGIDLSWTAAHGASSYEIWRAEGETATQGNAAKLINCAELSCLDGACTLGKYYHYWIKSKSSGGTSKDALHLEARRGPALPVSLAINGNTTVRAGSSIAFTATATYNDGTSKSVNPVWSITSGSSYGSINSSGTFTAGGTATQRSVTIKASYTENGVTVTATITITITTYTITVTFNGNGGTPSSQTQTYTAYGTYGSFPASPSWTGYTPSVWYTASSGGSQVTTSSTVPAANTTLYAHWSAIVPSAPSNVSATDGTSTANVTISWSAVSGATSYYVYRYTSNSSGSATQLGSTSSTSYADTTATPGVTYYYWVKAYRSDNGQYSAFSSYNTGYRKLSAPTNVSATDGTYTDRVIVSWNSVTGADKYYVYRYTSNSSGSASQLGSSTSTSYTDTTASPGVTYYYWVKAYANSSSSYSDFSSSNSGYRLKALASLTINGPAALDAGTNATYTCTATYSDNSTATVTPSWSITDGSSYASINSSGKLTANASTVDRSVTIRASYTDNGTQTATKTITIRKVIPLNVALDNMDLVFVTGGDACWSGTVHSAGMDGGDIAVSGPIAAGQTSWIETTLTGPGKLSYYNYLSSKSSKDTFSTGLDGNMSPSFTGSNFAPGGGGTAQTEVTIPTGSHTYRWSYARSTSGSTVYGTGQAWLDCVTYTRIYAPSAPTGVSATDGGTNAVIVTWNAVNGADSYEIWRNQYSAWPESYAVKIGTSTTTSFSDTTVPVGTTYYYYIKAVNVAGTSGWSSYDGGYRVRLATGLTLEGPEALPSGCSGAYKMKLSYSDGTQSDVTFSSYVTWSIPTNEFAEVSSSSTSDSEHGYYRYLTAKTVTSLKQEVVTAKYSYNGTTVTGTLTVSITPPGNLAYSYRLWPDGTGSLTGYLGSDKTTVTSLTLPSSINGVTIRGTYDSWMQNLSSLTSVTIPSTFGSVSDNMFYYCRKLTSVSIPNSVTNIGYQAFYYCDALQSITLPNSIKTIDNYAFRSCNNLQSVTLPNGLVTLGNYAFRGCAKLPSISLPNSLVTIGSDAFYACTALKQLTIPSSVKTIGSYAFEDCTAMTQIIIPDSVTSIENYAFYGCSALSSITIPDSVKSLYFAFEYCYGLKTVSLPDSLTSINAYSFYMCTNLTAITVGSNNAVYKDVDGVLFSKDGKTLVKYPDGKAGSYTIPSGTTTVGEYAFYNSPKLTSLTIPASVTSINFDYNAIYNCKTLQSISVNSSNPNYRCADGVVYNKNATTFYVYPLARTGNTFAVPDSVRNLNYSTGASSAVTNVLLSDSLKSLPSSDIANGKYASDKVPYQLMTPCTDRIYALEIDGENKVFAGQTVPLYAKGYFANGRFGYRAKADWMVVSGSSYASVDASTGRFTAKGDVTTTRNISVYAETTLGGAYASAGQYNVQIVPANTNKTVLAFGKYAYNRLRWLPVANAVKYNIRRGTSSSYGSASIIDTYLKETLDGTETYVDSSASLNTTYYYWVEALDANGNSINVSDYATAARATGDLTYVKDVLTKLYNGTYTDATFVSDAEKGILKEINYWKGVNSSWVNYIRTGSLTSISGANEMFWRSMYDLNTYIGIVMTEDAPSITGVTAASSSSVTVTWTPKLGATSYYLYRGTSANSSSATKIATVTSGTSYTDTSSHSTGTQYYYWVKAVTPVGTTDFGQVSPYVCQPTYLIVNLSAGSSASSYPTRTLWTAPSGGWDVGYKTTNLVLRLIQPGTYTMGCESSEVGYYGYEAQPHSVTISKPFYMGVFEVTQKQYALVMGSNPSSYKGDARPVEYVSYNTIRGSSEGAKWPSANSVDSTSFMGKIRARTGLTFDLPTEAQWEYVCRAGTTTALNSGKNLTNTSSDANMAEVGRYAYNSGYNSTCDGKGNTTYAHAEVGAYLPNNWGLYDMHGNVWEWCLDWYVSRGTSGFDTGAMTDPKGSASGSSRVIRGGSWNDGASYCRSAARYNGYDPSYSDYSFGFRLCCSAGQ